MLHNDIVAGYSDQQIQSIFDSALALARKEQIGNIYRYVLRTGKLKSIRRYIEAKDRRNNVSKGARRYIGAGKPSSIITDNFEFLKEYITGS